MFMLIGIYFYLNYQDQIKIKTNMSEIMSYLNMILIDNIL
jgi:hypothetical protein